MGLGDPGLEGGDRGGHRTCGITFMPGPHPTAWEVTQSSCLRLPDSAKDWRG